MQQTNRDLADEVRSIYLTDPHRRANTDNLIRSWLNINEEDEMTCQECEVILPDYLLAEQEGTSNLIRWQSVTLHLALCPHCTNELRETSALMALGLAEGDIESLQTPTPDLSFLRGKQKKPAQPQANFWHIDRMGHLIIRLAAALLSPPAQLAPAHVLRTEERIRTSEAGDESALGRLSLGTPTFDDLQVDVTVLPDKNDPALCIVIARVETPSRWPNVAGSEVMLATRDEVFSAVTNESGEATFRKIALTTLDNATLTVKPTR
jgi:hypothetical protein